MPHIATTTPESSSDLFDMPSIWREDVVLSLTLSGEERCAGASTSVAMPQLVAELVSLLDEMEADTVVDIGGGLGPLSAWLRSHTRHAVFPIEPSGASCRAARRLFGVSSARAVASALPIASASCGAAILNGVVSLLDDATVAIDEATRVTRPGGLVAIADLVAAGQGTIATDSNTFRTGEELAESLERIGCEVIHVACCEIGIGRWAPVQQRVHDEIDRRFAGRPGHAAWRRDDDELRSLAERGAIAGASLIARCPS
ncbi:MAG TPA: methyltransferase domain-containing protein [Ilumatobacter sp.]|nr:methyltransferase domain-containing protein [Ilumatobacter sp.]